MLAWFIGTAIGSVEEENKESYYLNIKMFSIMIARASSLSGKYDCDSTSGFIRI